MKKVVIARLRRPQRRSSSPRLPAKSGVGGGIISVSPGKFGIAVVSPPLDAAGNSMRAQRAIRDISAALNGNPYSAREEVTATTGHRY